MTMRMRGGMGMLGKFTGDIGNLDRTQRMAEQRRMEDGEEMKREREREAREREEEEARKGRRDDVDERAMRMLSGGDKDDQQAQRIGGQPSRRTSQQQPQRGEGRLSGQAKQGVVDIYEEPEWGGAPVPGAMIAELRECEAGRVLRVMELNQQSFFKVGSRPASSCFLSPSVRLPPTHSPSLVSCLLLFPSLHPLPSLLFTLLNGRRSTKPPKPKPWPPTPKPHARLDGTRASSTLYSNMPQSQGSTASFR
jgi:hypothetical protein